MKTIGVVLVLLLVVAGVAAGGSQAQTISATSVAFDQCQRDGAAGVRRCTPLVARMAMEPGEGEVDARGVGDGGANEADADVTPDRNFAQAMVDVGKAAAAAAELVREMFNHYFGGGLPILPDGPVATNLFDPMK